MRSSWIKRWKKLEQRKVYHSTLYGKDRTENKTILVTGHAGFIGSNLVHLLFNGITGGTVVGIDNLNSYYDVSLKDYRLGKLEERSKKLNYVSVRGIIADREFINKLFEEYHFDIVVNLAAQAGCGTTSRIQMYTSRATSSDSTTSRKPAATKKSNELMAHCYSKFYDIPSTGLRFFTVYYGKQR